MSDMRKHLRTSTTTAVLIALSALSSVGMALPASHRSPQRVKPGPSPGSSSKRSATTPARPVQLLVEEDLDGKQHALAHGSPSNIKRVRRVPLAGKTF
jgi:hypothetical protein